MMRHHVMMVHEKFNLIETSASRLLSIFIYVNFVSDACSDPPGGGGGGGGGGQVPHGKPQVP